MNRQEVIESLNKSAIIQTLEFRGETTLEIKKDFLKEVLLAFKNASFRTLMDLTAVDYLEPKKQTKIVYLLHNPDSFERVRVILFIARNEELESVVDLYEGADWYERELYDMFGVNFQGHSDLKRILMPDDWEGHPMLRDYALTEIPVEFKHGVVPKVPSEIIPNVKLKVIHD